MFDAGNAPVYYDSITPGGFLPPGS